MQSWLGTRGWNASQCTRASSWRQLALAIASEVDDALTIVDPLPAPKGKTARKWRGVEGALLLDVVDAVSEGLRGRNGGKRVKRDAVFAELQASMPGRYGKFSINHLRKSYHEAKRHHDKSTKRSPK